jgi:hypothetical protein
MEFVWHIKQAGATGTKGDHIVEQKEKVSSESKWLVRLTGAIPTWVWRASLGLQAMGSGHLEGFIH